MSVYVIGTYITRKAVKRHCSGSDPMKINPFKQVHQISIPCHIFSATEDDYISAQQGLEISTAWKGVCTYQTFR